MSFFRQSDHRGVIEELVQHDPYLCTSQRRADARMRASGERKVFLDAGAIQYERVRILPTPRIAIGGSERNSDLGSGRNHLIANLGFLRGEAECRFRGPLKAQHLFQETGYQAAIVSQARLQLITFGR